MRVVPGVWVAGAGGMGVSWLSMWTRYLVRSAGDRPYSISSVIPPNEGNRGIYGL